MNVNRRQHNLIQPTQSFSKTYLKRLESALRMAFDKDTCYPDERKDWSRDNPAYGQCAVAALVIQEFLGGDIVYDKDNIHFWNRVDDVDIDMSREQFPEGVQLRETRIRSRQELLEGPRAVAAETPVRYSILSERVRQIMSENRSQILRNL